jgi:hypothetical protein
MASDISHSGRLHERLTSTPGQLAFPPEGAYNLT